LSDLNLIFARIAGAAGACIVVTRAALVACVPRNFANNSEENTMNRSIALGLAMLAGGAIGATAVNALHAQGKAPGAYAVIDISAFTDPDLYKTLLPKAGPAMAAFPDAKFVIRTQNITALDGTPPKRFVVIAFDSMDQAKAWNASAGQQEVNAIRMKSSNSRSFIVEGMSN
jgi:uncharacterized protein (DUF1330 family)